MLIGAAVALLTEPNPEIFQAFEPEDAGEVASDPTHDDDLVADDVTVVMLPESWTPQPLDAAAEFASEENPADYSVNVVTVRVGTTVTWINGDADQIHAATAVDGSFDSGFLAVGEAWSYTFDTVGEFEYFCTPHPWMRAKVIVEG